jgi:hypothetical protein
MRQNNKRQLRGGGVGIDVNPGVTLRQVFNMRRGDGGGMMCRAAYVAMKVFAIEPLDSCIRSVWVFIGDGCCMG